MSLRRAILCGASVAALEVLAAVWLIEVWEARLLVGVL